MRGADLLVDTNWDEAERRSAPPLELRCTCRTRSLLAMVRPTRDGLVVLHIRVYKRDQLYGEVIAEDGTVRIRCRACLRWHVVRIRRERVLSEPQDLPPSIEVPALR